MSKSNGGARRAVALQYGTEHSAPVIIASGMGNLAEKIVEVASENGVPIYEDNSLATVLSQMELGREIPEELYGAIVEIYLYFLNFDPSDPEKFRRAREKWRAEQKKAEQQKAEQEKVELSKADQQEVQ